MTPPARRRPETYRSAVNEFAMRELIYGPTSAIELSDIGPHSHGTCSKVLRNFRDRGLAIVRIFPAPALDTTNPRGRPRKLYSLTETGRALATQWGITDD